MIVLSALIIVAVLDRKVYFDGLQLAENHS